MNLGILVFGAIRIGFKSILVIIEGNVDADKYMEILEQSGTFQTMNDLKGPGGYIFMQDDAPAHR
jgi:hypothetical protein